METKNINIGQDNQDFTLLYNPENDLPGWVTTVDELWMLSAGNSVYNFLMDHFSQLKYNKLENKKDFTASLPYNVFKDAMVGGEINRLRAYICTLYDVLAREHSIEKVYIGFLSTNSYHFISAVVANKGSEILLKVKLDDISPEDEIKVSKDKTEFKTKIQ